MEGINAVSTAASAEAMPSKHELVVDSPSKGREMKIGKYVVERDTLGVGSRSKVKAGRDAEGRRVAVKRVDLRRLDESGLAELHNEVRALERLRNVSGVVQLLEYWEDEHSRFAFLVMDRHAKDLYTYISERSRLPEAEARDLFRQVVDSVKRCQAAGVCHRDIKLENILVDRRGGSATLADFGFAAIDPADGVMDKFCGSPFTVAPEIIARTPYGMEADVWSLGIVLYAMVTGRFPFNDRTPRRLFARISLGRFSLPSSLSADCQDLLSRILVVDPERRISLDGILAHPWLAESAPLEV